MGLHWGCPDRITSPVFIKPKAERSSWQKVTAQPIRSGHEALATRGRTEAYDERTTTLLRTTSPARLTQLNRSGYSVYGPIPIAALNPDALEAKRLRQGVQSQAPRQSSASKTRPSLAGRQTTVKFQAPARIRDSTNTESGRPPRPARHRPAPAPSLGVHGFPGHRGHREATGHPGASTESQPQ